MLQSFDFTVVHRPGKQTVIPDMLFRLFTFEQQELPHMPVALAPIFRSISGVSELYATQLDNQHRLSMDNMHDLQLIVSDLDLFADALYTSATDVFSTIDPVKMRAEQEIEFKPYFRYLRSESTVLFPRETVGSMSHFYLHNDFLYQSYVPGHLRT